GESWAWAALPGVYWGMEVTRRRPWLGILLVSITYAGLLLSHNITALWASIFIAAYPLLIARDFKWPFAVAAGGLLGTAMSAFFQKGLIAQQRQRLVLFLVFTSLVLFIMSPQMPWGKTPALLRYLQFPWRLLIFTAFFGAGAAAMASPIIDRWIHPAIITGL